MAPTTRDVLMEARAKLDRGWAQGPDITKPEHYCLLTALAVAGKSSLGARLEAVFIVTRLCGGSAIQFNDYKGRIKADILAVIDQALLQVP